MKQGGIKVYNRTRIPFLSKSKIEKLWALVSHDEGKKMAGRLEITAVEDEDIRRLKERYFGQSVLTDVVAFPYGEEGPGGTWGEIVMCLPEVLRQARDHGEDEKKEILTVLIHGFLHLFGYSDHDAQSRCDMEARQERLLVLFLAEEARQKLVDKALRAGRKAYAPYSGFRVGAAIETEKKVYTGCNVENASSGLTVCAERVAVFKAVSENIKKFRRIAVAGSYQALCFPCGACRQVLYEFSPAVEVIAANCHGRYQVYSLQHLLPHSFTAPEKSKKGPSNLDRDRQEK